MHRSTFSSFSLILVLALPLHVHAQVSVREQGDGRRDDSVHDDSRRARQLDTVVVTATRGDADALDTPASISTVDVEDNLRMGASPAELLRDVPGVVARDRYNYAQDTQLSIRGFGARSSFGVRGVRLYTDGIPASQPDGQGQLSHFNLASASRIEVLRGPFSALYGNASGGVVQLFTAPGDAPPEWRFGGVAGSHGTSRGSVGLSGASEDFDARIDLTRFASDGFRPHSRVLRHSANARIGARLRNGGELTLVGNLLDQPYTQDPLGLTREQFDADPHQTTPEAVQFDTRKRVRQGIGGAILETPLGERDALRLMGYGGTRSITQFLSIPAAAQAAPTHSGGVIDLHTGFGGGDLRWTRSIELGGEPLAFHAGLSFDDLRQRRLGFENFIGSDLGVAGRLRRDEAIRVRGFDQYAQLEWALSQRWNLLAGARHSGVDMRVSDRYLAAGNGDDSGRVRYSRTSPVAGLLFRASDRLHLYASHGRGFETPTITEVAYRANGGSGLALDLAPVTTGNTEIGAKWRSERLRAELALFESRGDNELAVATGNAGRTTYRNIGRSRRRGAELSVDWSFAPDWNANLAWTRLDARFLSGFLGCSARCTVPDTPVAAGARIAGVRELTASAALRWEPTLGWHASLDAFHTGDVPVDDFGSDHANAYTLLGVEAGYRWQGNRGSLRAFLRVDNVADRIHVASVIVNDGNGRYFEPGLGRTWMLGVEWRGRQR